MEGEVQMRRSIRNKLIVFIFIGCLLPYFIGGLYLKNYMEDWLYESSIKNTNELIYQVGILIDKALIVKGEQLVSMIAESSEVRNIGNNISTYMDYNASDGQVTLMESELEIEDYFRNIKEN